MDGYTAIYGNYPALTRDFWEANEYCRESGIIGRHAATQQIRCDRVLLTAAVVKKKCKSVPLQPRGVHRVPEG